MNPELTILSVLTQAIPAVVTMVTVIAGVIMAYFNHKEAMAKLHRLNENVNGKIDKLLQVSGDAREAVGHLKGVDESKTVPKTT